MLRLVSKFILSFFIVLSYSSYASFDKEKVKSITNDYLTLLQSYSNLPKDKSAIDYRARLIQLFDKDAITGYEYASDLFTSEEQSDPSFYSYLNYIEDNYNNKISVTFSNIYYFGCSAKIKGTEFAFVMVDKSLDYIGDKSIGNSGKSKKVKLLIGINTHSSDYKINMVVFPEGYKEQDKNCIIDQKQDQQNILFEENYTFGNVALSKKDFVAAKNFFEKALDFKSNDKNAKQKLNECNSKLNFEFYKSDAEKDLVAKKFSKAKDGFAKIVSQYPEQKTYAAAKIKECDEGLRIENYQQYKKAGDDYFNKEFFSEALNNYQHALEYQPNDSYIIDMIKKCNYSSPTKINSEIKRAITLAEKENKLAQAFKILSYYEGSGALNGQNYYFMAMMMDNRDDNVDKVMGYTKKQCFQLAQEYCIKGIKKGSEKARDMWNNILRIR